MNYDKFIAEFQSFCENETVTELSSESQVSLFGTYCNVMVNMNTSKSKSRPQPHSKGGATGKQIGFIKTLIKQGNLPEDSLEDDLSKKEASDLIEQGLRDKKDKKKPKEEQEDFAGSYNVGGLFS